MKFLLRPRCSNYIYVHTLNRPLQNFCFFYFYLAMHRWIHLLLLSPCLFELKVTNWDLRATPHNHTATTMFDFSFPSLMLFWFYTRCNQTLATAKPYVTLCPLHNNNPVLCAVLSHTKVVFQGAAGVAECTDRRCLQFDRVVVRGVFSFD